MATANILALVFNLMALPGRAQDMTCPIGTSTAPGVFYIIGASGGDSKAACENTFEATRAGIEAGMNAVELDISMTEDKVVFLWNDPNPIEPSSQARTTGLFVNGMCRPVFRTIAHARNQVWSEIYKNFGYTNETGSDQEVEIPTLHEWLIEFAARPEILLIVLDIKVNEVEQADYLVDHIMSKAKQLGAETKIRLLSSHYTMVAALQSSLERADYDQDIAGRVWGGTTVTLHFGSSEYFDGVEESKKECYGLTSVGQSESSNGWREYQNMVRRMVSSRDKEATEGKKYIPVLTWRINTVEKMAWLICSGVDGIYTDDVAEMWLLQQRKMLGDIVCCARDIVLPCLMNTDSRVTGQGCSTYGLSWHDQKVEPCSLLPAPLDFDNMGTQLTCRENRFAPKGHDINCS